MSNIDWSLSGVHGLNKYVWHLLQTELGWSAGTYSGLIPITTPQQQPEFNAVDAPYIVYTYSKTNTGEDFFLEGEIVAYTIYSADESDIRKVVNLLSAKLNKRDTTAKEANAFLSASGSSANKEFDYKWISVTNAQGAQPTDQTGGRMDGLVMVRYAFTHYNPTTGLSIRY